MANQVQHYSASRICFAIQRFYCLMMFFVLQGLGALSCRRGAALLKAVQKSLFTTPISFIFHKAGLVN